VVNASVSDHGVDGIGGIKAGNVLVKDNMDGCGDAARDRVVDTVPLSVSWVTDHDAAESLFA
jgi:hypothetical protein